LGRPTIRVVFDPVAASCYVSAVQAFDQYGYTMGELIDSSAMAQTSLSEVQSRVASYVATLGSTVDIWEIGNEVNGNWLGSDVPAKVEAMYTAVKAAGYQTELTLYYQPPQTVSPGYDMIPWEENLNNIPESMHQGLNYVLVSYYETDNDNIRPTQAEWDAIFKQLATDFPNAKVGFGEIGLDNPVTSATLDQAESILGYYYTLEFPDIPQYTRACFWWYAAEDFVPTTNWPPLFSDLQTDI
jgi:hypothetical protein